MDLTYPILLLAVCVVAAVIILTLFYKILESAGKRIKKEPLTKKFQIAGVIDDTAFLNIHLTNGKIFEKVRCLGYTNDIRHSYICCDELTTQPAGDAVPPEFSDLMILQDSAGVRFLSPTRLVNLIEILPAK